MSLKMNVVKSTQLGMPYAKASRKLWNQVIYQLIKEAKRDVCYRCGKRIESIDEVSMDHKKPWLHLNVKRFWDLKNIAFSHRRCNFGARRGSPRS